MRFLEEFKSEVGIKKLFNDVLMRHQASVGLIRESHNCLSIKSNTSRNYSIIEVNFILAIQCSSTSLHVSYCGMYTITSVSELICENGKLQAEPQISIEVQHVNCIL